MIPTALDIALSKLDKRKDELSLPQIADAYRELESLRAELTALREENERLTKAYQELELLVSQAQPESHWLGEGKTT